MYRVADVMTKRVTTLKETDDLALADAIFALGNIRHLPVVNKGRLVGLITQRDLLRTLAERGDVDARQTLAGEVMRTELSTVTGDMPVTEAAELMADQKYGCLPVVEHGVLVGIVTEVDLLHLAAKLALEVESQGTRYWHYSRH
jgi:CBS domain-containing membrane protein